MSHSSWDRWNPELMTSCEFSPQKNAVNCCPLSPYRFQIFQKCRRPTRTVKFPCNFGILLVIVLFFVGTCQASVQEARDPVPRLLGSSFSSVDICGLHTRQHFLDIECLATEKPSANSITWIRNDKEFVISEIQGAEILQNGSLRLPLWGSGLDDRILGSYQCIVRYQPASNRSHITRVLNSDSICTGRLSPIDKVFKLNKHLLLPCTNYPNADLSSAEVLWEKCIQSHCIDVKETDPKYAITPDGSLAFIYTDESDSGTQYRCQLKLTCNGGQYCIRNKFNLKQDIVTDLPETELKQPEFVFISANNSVSVLEGQPIRLQCIFGGRSPNGEIPSITWIGPHHNTVAVGQWLIVPKASKSQDEGKYRCEAKFPGSVISAKDVEVKVEGQNIENTPNYLYPDTSTNRQHGTHQNIPGHTGSSSTSSSLPEPRIGRKSTTVKSPDDITHSKTTTTDKESKSEGSSRIPDNENAKDMIVIIVIVTIAAFGILAITAGLVTFICVHIRKFKTKYSVSDSGDKAVEMKSMKELPETEPLAGAQQGHGGAPNQPDVLLQAGPIVPQGQQLMGEQNYEQTDDDSVRSIQILLVAFQDKRKRRPDNFTFLSEAVSLKLDEDILNKYLTEQEKRKEGGRKNLDVTYLPQPCSMHVNNELLQEPSDLVSSKI